MKKNYLNKNFENKEVKERLIEFEDNIEENLRNMQKDDVKNLIYFLKISFLKKSLIIIK